MSRAAEVLETDGDPPARRLAAWEDEHPGLRAGVTAGAEVGDLGLASERPPAEWARRMEDLVSALDGRRIAVPLQEHGRRIVEVGGAPAGVLVAGRGDGLVTDEAGTVLVVTVADCVPVFVHDPARDALGLLHAGWRGTAAGVLEAGVGAMEERFGSRASRLRLHLGPAICGDCYEVGPEVPRALGRSTDGGTHVDLRAELADRAAEAGVPADRVSRSPACTLCGADHFFSHRGTGTTKRMAAFLGWQAGRSGV